METRPDMICEAPMSYTGAFRRAQLWLSGISTYWIRYVVTLLVIMLWWVLVTAWYLVLINSVMPLIWTYPYRMMRRRQRQERYVASTAARLTIARYDDYTRNIPTMPKND